MKISKTYKEFHNYLNTAAPIPVSLPLLEPLEDEEDAGLDIAVQ